MEAAIMAAGAAGSGFPPRPTAKKTTTRVKKEILETFFLRKPRINQKSHGKV
jgi:hypothetical protein